ncbi:hypothetical protein [Cellulophaga sp. Hel_I_12]|uniref:hypothetical protein n=1 Tax=Cellulophaga sp. Hel_I_12 TaxID=1249972 RepID=UPI00068A38F3|nr:hypothetical protein [Cellulophaga sp. Hel_I_12]
MFYYLTIALQAYCVYHCFTNRNSYYWLFAIIFLPIVGSLLYIFMNIANKQEINKVQGDIVSAINPTKKITDLEKKFEFSDTFQNQVALADAYLEAKMFDKAILNFEESLKDVFVNDHYAMTRLLEAYYYSSQSDRALEIAERLKDEIKFKKTKASFLYALALEKEGNIDKAEEFLAYFDAPYSYYEERFELAKFYIRNGNLKKARTLLEELVTESERMTKTSYRQNSGTLKQIKELQKTNL